MRILAARRAGIPWAIISVSVAACDTCGKYEVWMPDGSHHVAHETCGQALGTAQMSGPNADDPDWTTFTLAYPTSKESDPDVGGAIGMELSVPDIAAGGDVSLRYLQGSDGTGNDLVFQDATVAVAGNPELNADHSDILILRLSWSINATSSDGDTQLRFSGRDWVRQR